MIQGSVGYAHVRNVVEKRRDTLAGWKARHLFWKGLFLLNQ